MNKTQLKKKTNNKFPMKGDPNYIDRLDEDPIIKSQRYFVVSFISPEGIRNTTLRGFKLRYVSDDLEEVKKKADEFRQMDGNKFDVYVGEVGKWLPWNPDRSGVKSQVYAESELNDLMKGYEENTEKAKQIHTSRVDDMKAYRNNPQRQNEVKNQVKQKHLNKQKQVNKSDTTVTPVDMKAEQPLQKNVQLVTEEHGLQEVVQLLPGQSSRTSGFPEVIPKTLPSLSQTEYKSEVKTEMKQENNFMKSLELDIKEHEQQLKTKRLEYEKMTKELDCSTMKYENLINVQKEMNNTYTELSGVTLPDTDEIAKIKQLMSSV